MNPGLRYLLLRRGPGALRQLRRKLTGRQGKTLVVGTGLLFAAIAATQTTFIALAPSTKVTGVSVSPDDIRLYAPPLLLFVALVGIRPGAFYFKAAEVQYLFPAPISRIELLLFNILSRMQIVVLSTLWVGLFTVRHAATWYGGILAVFMLLSFNQLTAQLGGVWLAGLDPAPAARKRRWAGLVALLLFVGAGVVASLPESPAGPAETVAALIRHPLIATLSWATRPFVELFLSADPGKLLFYGGIAGATLGIEVAAMLRLDQRYLDGLVAGAGGEVGRSKKVRLRSDRKQRHAKTSNLGFELPIRSLPRWAGSGPLAWRQVQELVRQPAQILRGGLGLLAVIPVFVMRASAAEHEAARLGAVSVATALLMIPMMVDGVDFRKDLDRMSVLRSLPMSPRAVVMGQLIPTSLLLGFWMMIGSILILIIIEKLTLGLVFLLAMTIPPFALMTAAIDNWLFLLMPYRIRTRDSGEATFVGRLTIVMSIKMVALLTAICISCGAVIAVWYWVAKSKLLVGLIAFASLACCCVPLIFGVARSFERFDVAGLGAE